MHQQCRAERSQNGKRHAERDEIHRVQKRLPEKRRLQQAHIVFEADETQIPYVGECVDVEISEAHGERTDHRNGKKNRDRRERRRDEQPSGVRALHPSFALLSSIQRRFSRMRSARASSSAGAFSPVISPCTTCSTTSRSSVAMRSHSGTFGAGRTRSS